MTATFAPVSCDGPGGPGLVVDCIWPKELQQLLVDDVNRYPAKHGLVKSMCDDGDIFLESPEEVHIRLSIDQFIESTSRLSSKLVPGPEMWSRDRNWEPELSELSDAVWGVKGSLDIMELDEGEFFSDGDCFIQSCDEKEALLSLQARSPLPGGLYLVPSVFTSLDILGYKDEQRVFTDTVPNELDD